MAILYDRNNIVNALTQYVVHGRIPPLLCSGRRKVKEDNWKRHKKGKKISNKGKENLQKNSSARGGTVR
ncbi:hypothetical protein B5F77_11055 [Parabacteroides sp. An277]|nr:hypothetical protein B5F77_11055 [Parabacteroides sp. An277]